MLVASLTLAASVQAASYSFNFLSTDSLYQVSGVFGTSNTLNSVGGYDITSITGLVTGLGGGMISALVINPNQPLVTTNFGFNYDNVLFPTLTLNPVMNTNGVLFDTASSGKRWNLWGNALGDYELYSYAGGTLNTAIDVHGNLSIAAVPEPETYAMMLAGLGLMGFIARRKAA